MPNSDLINRIISLINEINDIRQLESFLNWIEHEINSNRICPEIDQNHFLMEAFFNAKNRIELKSNQE